MMQKEGGAPFCILCTQSVVWDETRVKKNPSKYVDMKKRLTGIFIDYKIHKIYRHYF